MKDFCVTKSLHYLQDKENILLAVSWLLMKDNHIVIRDKDIGIKVTIEIMYSLVKIFFATPYLELKAK
jgi:hypothetical protein